MTLPPDAPFAGFLDGLRVLEIGNELGEYCGKVLAGLGADVVRVEPPGGETTRTIGPFYKDVPHPDRSLYFWHYNFSKRSIVLDLDDKKDQEAFRQLIQTADVLLDSRPRHYLSERGFGYDELRALNDRLVYARISPFGDTGPWADFVASDLVHLALGGVMMNCGYDPAPGDVYDTPPIAPAMWHSYHIAGELSAMSILGALAYRLRSGHGQELSTSVHHAVSQNTETDLPDWVYLRQAHLRLTCRHSTATSRSPSIAITKDGRYILPYRTYSPSQGDEWDQTVALLKKYGWQHELEEERFQTEYRNTPEARARLASLIDSLIGQMLYKHDIWREAQALDLPWAPIRKPEENLKDDHWWQRGAYFDVTHPELGETFTYTGAKWYTEGIDWRQGPRPPLVGEHTDEVLAEWKVAAAPHELVAKTSRTNQKPLNSPHGKPFALSDIRVVDLSWMLASAGAGRFLAALGAEVIKVEHISRPDALRFSPLGAVPAGERPARDAATGPLPFPAYQGRDTNPNRCGFFMEINSGKRALSLNLKNPEARAVLEDLIRDADIIMEGFSPGTMIRMGLGYERLKELNPNIIYVQQSGLGEHGSYGRARTFGPSAQAISGISEMSGLPEPYPPAGIGYSYLDWFGAYNMANAILAALYRRDATGLGCHIDASQAETGLYLTGTAILDHSVNGRRWSRYGNRSPYQQAAPHGAYRVDGNDRWIAIGAFTEEHWSALIDVLDRPQWQTDPRFASLADRLAHQDELDLLVESATQSWDGTNLMTALQARGVPAGICQTAQDRCEDDPQLKHLGWQVELKQTDVGWWPVKELPTAFSETPPYIGGPVNRSGPNYGEDNDYVLGQILGLDEAGIAHLRDTGAL